jgi:hypothetical protein
MLENEFGREGGGSLDLRILFKVSLKEVMFG